MTAYSPYQAFPGQVPPAAAAPPPIFVAVADPVPQRRLTVFFRGLLLIPHLVVLYFIAIAAAVVAFVGWWGALFTGQLPEFAVSFLSGCLRWTTRVSAYELLLTDVYPPFLLGDDPAYPVQMAIPAPQRLNRAAVFFRFILVIPVGILTFIVIIGAMTLMGFIAWLITLITGRLPASFHVAYVAALRFQARYAGYYYMLTPAYPGGLYGDKPGTAAWADGFPAAQAPGFGAPGPAYGAPQGYGAPGPAYGNPADSAPAGYGTPEGYGAAPGYGASRGYGAPVPGGYGTPGGYGMRPAFQPATWLLQLASGAKKLMTTFIVLGVVLTVGIWTAEAVVASAAGSRLSNTETAILAVTQLNSSYVTLTNGMTSWEQATTNCNGNLTCMTRQDDTLVKAFNTFSSQLAATSVPAGADAAKAKLGAASAQAASDFTQLSHATTPAMYQSTVSETGVQPLLNAFYADYTALVNNLQTY